MYAHGLMALDGILMDQRRPAEAGPAFREALAIREAALPLGHPDRAVAESVLGGALAALDRRAEAEPLLRRSLRVLEADLGPGHARTIEARERLRAFEDGHSARSDTE